MPDQQQIASLQRLCQFVLEPDPRSFRQGLTITSGYRCVKLNKAVGGSGTSQHCMGEAADFHVPGVPDLEVANWIAQNLRFDQLILEFPPEGWVHCSYGPRMRQESLTAKKIGGTTKYIPGFHP
jgi:zinc D-Ala-D-Ala carboxypeptidase